MAHPGMMEIPNRWLLTSSAELADRLPGPLYFPDNRRSLSIARVVLVLPDTDVDIERVILALGNLDMPRGTPVVFVDMCGPGEKKPGRHLNVLVSCARIVFPAACGKQLYHTDLLEAMRAFVDVDDLVLVARGQGSYQGFNEPPAEMLMHGLQVPVLEIGDILPPWHKRLVSRVRRMLFNLFPLLVVGGFFWVQTQIDQNSQGWVDMLALGMTIIFELAIIFLWSLFLD